MGGGGGVSSQTTRGDGRDWMAVDCYTSWVSLKISAEFLEAAFVVHLGRLIRGRRLAAGRSCNLQKPPWPVWVAVSTQH